MQHDVNTILRAEGLVKEFRGFVALDGVDLAVQRNTIHALIGPNGAGKTTCFNLLTKHDSPTRGKVYFDDVEITGSSPAEVARLGIGRSFQISAVFPELSVLENVRLALQSRRSYSMRFWVSNKILSELTERAIELIGSVGLLEFVETSAKNLSYGRKRALELATTLALDPRLLLLDEPMAGLAHEDVGRISDLIREIAKGRTVLMVEHNMKVVADLCDTITVLQRGKVLAEGNYETVSQDPNVISAYVSTKAPADE